MANLFTVDANTPCNARIEPQAAGRGRQAMAAPMRSYPSLNLDSLLVERFECDPRTKDARAG